MRAVRPAPRRSKPTGGREHCRTCRGGGERPGGREASFGRRLNNEENQAHQGDEAAKREASVPVSLARTDAFCNLTEGPRQSPDRDHPPRLQPVPNEAVEIGPPGNGTPLPAATPRTIRRA